MIDSRRSVLAAGVAAAALASVGVPYVARAQSRPARQARMVPHADLRVLDPIWTTANISSYHGLMMYDTLFGIDVLTYRVVALKSQQHFLAGFRDIAGTIIRCDTPGLTTSNLEHLPYRNIQRPIWPLDPFTSARELN